MQYIDTRTGVIVTSDRDLDPAIYTPVAAKKTKKQTSAAKTARRRYQRKPKAAKK